MPFVVTEEIQPGMCIVDYVMDRQDGSGTTVNESVSMLKEYGIHAEAVRTNALAVRAVVVRHGDSERAIQLLREHYYED